MKTSENNAMFSYVIGICSGLLKQYSFSIFTGYIYVTFSERND